QAAIQRAGVDGVADADAAEAQRVVHGTRLRAERVDLVLEDVMVVQLQNERDLPGVLRRARLQKAERGGIRAAARLDREPEMVQRVVGVGVGCEAAGRAMLEALVNGQNDELTRAPEAAMVQQPVQVGQNTRVLALIPAHNLLNRASGCCGLYHNGCPSNSLVDLAKSACVQRGRYSMSIHHRRGPCERTGWPVAADVV